MAYWTWIGAAAVAAILLQILAVRRARNQRNPDSADDATFARQSTLASIPVTLDAGGADRTGTHDSRG